MRYQILQFGTNNIFHKKAFILFFFLNALQLSAQNVGIGTPTPDPSAKLEINSTNSGLLTPRMTTAQRTAIATPATGLLVFDNSTNSFWFYNGTAWEDLGASADNLGNHIATQNVQLDSNWVSGDGDSEGILISSSGNVAVGTTNLMNTFQVGRGILSSTDLLTDPSAITASGTFISNGVGPVTNTIDNLNNIGWSGNNIAPAWWQYDFGAGNEKLVANINLASLYTLSGFVEASNDNTNWTQVYTPGNISGSFNINPTIPYRYYRIHITNVSPINFPPVIFEIEMFEYDSALGYRDLFSVSQNGTVTINTSYSLPIMDGTAGQAIVTDGAGNVSWSTNVDNLGNHIATTNLNMNGNAVSHAAADSYDKLRVWSTGEYALGMNSAMTYGYLNDFATTFTMNDLGVDRGWVWRHFNDTKAEGAMSLTTDGRLFVNNNSTILGTLTLGAYTLPNTDGMVNQFLQTDGAGNVAWATVTSTDNQDLSLTGNILSLTNDGTSVDLSPFVNDTTSLIIDADKDTKIDVEETADEDIIRFDLAGTERWRMNNNTLESSNTLQNVLIGQNTGLNSIGAFGIAGNTLIGHNVGQNLTVHQNNSILGDRALTNATSSRNSALGGLALFSATTGGDNVAVGYSSLSSITTGNENTGIGNYVLSGLEGGIRNVALGNYAGAGSPHTTNYSVYVGNYAGYNSTRDHLLYIQNHTGSPTLESVPLIWGDFLNDSVRVNGTLTIGSTAAGTGDGDNLYTFPTSDGLAGQSLVTDGVGQLSWGVGADNLGNHIATTNLQSDNFWLSNDGDAEGIFVAPNGNVGVGMEPTELFEVGGVTSSTYSTDIIAGGTATGPGFNPALAIDNVASTWFTNVGAQLGAWQYDFGVGNEQTIAQYTLVTNAARPFNNWNFEASNDGSTWTILHTGNAIPSTAIGSPSIYSFSNGTPYRYYRVNITAAPNNQSSIIEIEMMTQNISYGDVFSVTSTGAVTINNNYTLPTTDGVTNQFLQTDGAGNVSWATITNTDNQTLTPNDLNGQISIAGGNTINISTISDANSDTKIQVEEGANDDIIRFDMAGTEFFTMNNGRLNVLNTGNSIFIGNEAGLNDDLSNNLNVFVGSLAGRANTSGGGNTFLGSTAGLANISGGLNTFIGEGTGRSNTTSWLNTYIGSGAGLNATGGSNVFIGAASGESITGSGNVMLGNNVGRSLTNISNRLFIDNSQTPTPLIYGEFDNNILRTNGTLQINNPATTGYAFPTTDGTANQTLQTDGTGNVSWSSNVNATSVTTNSLTVSNLPAFNVTSNSINITTVGNHEITNWNASLNTDLFNDGNHLNLVNGRFIAPVDGYYHFSTAVRLDLITSGYARLMIVKNGVVTFRNGLHSIRNADAANGAWDTQSVSGVLKLSAGDYVSVFVSSSADANFSIQTESGFSGYLISEF